MILVFGGTTEGRAAVEVLDEAGKPFYYSTRGNGQSVHAVHGEHVTGGMDALAMESFCKAHGIRLLVDAGHPFATELHRNVVKVAERLAIPAVRYERVYPERNPAWVWCDSYADAVARLQEQKVVCLLALTGAQTISALRAWWANGETWFAEIPTYSPGFSVGVIGDMFLNPYFNLRFIPTINFGDKRFVFREQETGEEFRTSVRSSYLTLPLSVKYSSFRLNNCRPYLTAGVYGAMDLGRKRGNPLYLKGFDYGLEFGIGCNIYLPFFRLCPELKFSFGLPNLLVKDRPDLEGQETIKYTEALSKATSRMVTLTFNFE